MKKEKNLQEKMLDEMAFNMLEDGKIIQSVESGNLYKVDKKHNGIFPYGGGFLIPLENISLMNFKEFDMVENGGKFEKAYYNFDDNDFVLEGFYKIPYKYWNGWGCPYFTKKTIEKVMEYQLFDNNWYILTYDKKNDSYTLKIGEMMDDGKFYMDDEYESKGFDIVHDGKVYHVYDFSFGCTWNHYNDLDEVRKYDDINTVYLNN